MLSEPCSKSLPRTPSLACLVLPPAWGCCEAAYFQLRWGVTCEDSEKQESCYPESSIIIALGPYDFGAAHKGLAGLSLI